MENLPDPGFLSSSSGLVVQDELIDGLIKTDKSYYVSSCLFIC